MKDKLLCLLRQTDAYQSGELLGRQLGVSRAAVWKLVEQLRQAGYEIAAVSRRGYLLVREADILNQVEAKRVLCASAPGWSLFYETSTDSTNLMAKRAAETCAPHQSVFLAQDQLKGRGRLGRGWLSQPDQSLTFSLLLRPEASPEKIAPVTLFAGLIVVQALEELLADCGAQLAIKWPNDIIAPAAGQKVGGILTETLLEENRISALIIGIGLNLSQSSFPKDLPQATSILAQWSVKLRRLDVLATIMQNLIRHEKTIFTPAAWLPDYRKHCLSLGREVLLHEGQGEAELCQALDVDETGQLLVLDERGRKRAVRAGEVSVRGLNGYI